jgi:hypothetical protein
VGTPHRERRGHSVSMTLGPPACEARCPHFDAASHHVNKGPLNRAVSCWIRRQSLFPNRAGRRRLKVREASGHCRKPVLEPGPDPQQRPKSAALPPASAESSLPRPSAVRANHEPAHRSHCCAYHLRRRAGDTPSKTHRLSTTVTRRRPWPARFVSPARLKPARSRHVIAVPQSTCQGRSTAPDGRAHAPPDRCSLTHRTGRARAPQACSTGQPNAWS